MLVDDDGRQVRIGIYGLAFEGSGAGRILLTRLAPSEVDAGFWTLPGGGLNWGEHPLEGLSREFIEETGLVPMPLLPLGVHSFCLTSEQRRFPGPPIQVLQVVYLVAPDGVPTHEVDGSTVEARWVPMRELDSLHLVELVRVALAFRATHISQTLGAD